MKSRARTMLLVFSREGGDSFRNLDRRERWPLQKAATHVFHPTPTKVHGDRISLQNQDGLNTAHKTQPQSAGCGGSMSGRNTMLLVSNRGGPGSYRSREQRVVISQKAQQILMSLNIHFQNSWVRRKTVHRTRQALPACCGGDVMMSSRRNTLLSFSWGCDGCPSRVCCLLLSAAVCCCLQLLLTKNANYTTSGLLGTRHST